MSRMARAQRSHDSFRTRGRMSCICPKPSGATTSTTEPSVHPVDRDPALFLVDLFFLRACVVREFACEAAAYPAGLVVGLLEVSESLLIFFDHWMLRDNVDCDALGHRGLLSEVLPIVREVPVRAA